MVDERRGDAGSLHARWPAVERRPEVASIGLCVVDAPAVVLGSTQSEAVVDASRAARAGIAVTRRRSGGGAVLVTPDDPAWIDVWIPAGHPLWRPDVSRSFDWLGDVWVEALSHLGLVGLTAHRQGPLPSTRWSALVCFGGIATGEVLTADGRKVVGLAQRRNRLGSWFHGAAVLHWDPSPLVGVLALSDGERRAAVEELSRAVVGVADLSADGVPGREAVADSLISALPSG
jgi:lipoate-protein ligase A